MKTLSFSGRCLYVLQTLVAHGVMVAYYVVALVEFGSDVGGGVDELIGVCGVRLQAFDKGLLELLRTLLLYSLVLHVVGKDEVRIAHPGDVEGGEEEGETSHYLQEECRGGTVLGVLVGKIDEIVGKVDVEVGGRELTKSR